MTALAIVDIDGVVADVGHRLHHVANLGPGERPNWDAFFDLCHLDPPIPTGIQLVRVLSTIYRVHLLSGRAERIREATVRWLTEHQIEYEQLWLRPENDRRPDFIFKGEVLDRLAETETVALVVDDSDRIVDAALRRGILALHFRVPGVERDRSIKAWSAPLAERTEGRQQRRSRR